MQMRKREKGVECRYETHCFKDTRENLEVLALLHVISFSSKVIDKGMEGLNYHTLVTCIRWVIYQFLNI
jgi:hypothetical protein